QVEGFSHLLALNEEAEIITGLNGEIDLFALFDSDICRVFGNDLAWISDVVAKHGADKRNDESGFGCFLSFDNGLELTDFGCEGINGLINTHAGVLFQVGGWKCGSRKSHFEG